MELSRKFCRICVSESEFNVSLFGNYCRRTNMVDKILVCLKIVIEETDTLDTICYKCAENLERYYDFITFVRKSQTKLEKPRQLEDSLNNRRRVASIHVNEQVIDADYTFSFFEIPEEKKAKPSTPMFPYFSPPSKVMKQGNEPIWKTPRDVEKRDNFLCQHKHPQRPRQTRQQSRDLFESQSLEAEEPKSQEWNLASRDNNNILKRLKDKCFGWSDF